MLQGPSESGHALVEALLLGLLLLVPVAWMLSVFAELHAAALATTSAVREAGFEAARAPDPISADRSMLTSIEAAVSDHGLDPDLVSVTWEHADGWSRGGSIEVMVTYDVAAFQAPLLGRITQPSIPVTARHVTTIDRYRSRDG